MTTNPAADRPFDRDVLSPVDAALGTALARAGQELGQVPAEVAGAHLDAIATLATAHAHTAAAPAPTTAGWRTRFRRVVGLTAVKVAVGAGVAAAATAGGLGATGNLPDPVQQVVSDGAGWFGVHLPAPAVEPTRPEHQVDVEDPGQGPSTPPHVTPLPPSGDTDQDTVEAPGMPGQDGPPDDEPGPPSQTPADNDLPPARPGPRSDPGAEHERDVPPPDASPARSDPGAEHERDVPPPDASPAPAPSSAGPAPDGPDRGPVSRYPAGAAAPEVAPDAGGHVPGPR